MQHLVSPLAIAESLSDYWSPKVTAEVDEAYVKVAKAKGTLTWHAHELEDEMFLVLRGQLMIEMEDREVLLNEGEMFVEEAIILIQVPMHAVDYQEHLLSAAFAKARAEL